MTKPRLFPVWLNPLRFFDIEEPIGKQASEPLTLESLVAFACQPGVPSRIEDLIERYREITGLERSLFAPPSEESILTKLVWPLRNAKASYMFGNYLGTVSQCGIVAEMVAILLFDIHEFTINGSHMNNSTQESVFGSTFERLGQERRVRVLNAFGLIAVDVKESFDLIRTRRNRYLHSWSQDSPDIRGDAKQSYGAAVSLVSHVIGQDIRDGRIALNPQLVKYLESKGLISKSRSEIVAEEGTSPPHSASG